MLASSSRWTEGLQLQSFASWAGRRGLKKAKKGEKRWKKVEK